MTSSRGTRERGAAAVEMVGTLPILLLAAFVAFQMTLVGWTVIETGRAAQSGARAVSLERDPAVAVRESLPGVLEPTRSSGTLTGGGVRYTVEVEIPTVVPFSIGTVNRTADMPVRP